MPFFIVAPHSHRTKNGDDDDDDDGDDDGDAIALQYNDRIQIRSILCVFSTDEPCKDRLILTAKKTDKTN